MFIPHFLKGHDDRMERKHGGPTKSNSLSPHFGRPRWGVRTPDTCKFSNEQLKVSLILNETKFGSNLYIP